ncbi:MAG TPA: alpha-L-fucosidase [Ilumatobacteraceae bacterium]|nr:alpha-L-fucosidase [Ilumatobacteraceae bacterium]
MPAWWEQRRFGMFVHANLATVPAWSPIGQYSDWYRSHLGDAVPDVLLHPTPMVEVLAHHRDRWGHVERFDDFWPLLSFERFDPDAWTGLALAAGMGYTVFVAKHHDGLCWWDAPGTDRTVLHDGPGRNVLAEYAAACERSGLVFGTYYSLLDWGDDRYQGDDYVDRVLHPHVLDLVERYGSKFLWGDGHWGHGPDHWRSQVLIDTARELDAELIVNDRWCLEGSDVAVYEYHTPDGIVEQPWELCRGIAYSFCHNRAERAEHHMTGREIVALLTEVVAKGGNLLLNVGPAADGTIPELQAEPLRDAGRWITAHDDVISGSQPWTVWGDELTRYTVTGERLNAIDLTGAGTFEALGRRAGRVRSVEAFDGAPTLWEQLDDRLQIRRLDRSPAVGAAVYHVELEAPPDAPIELFTTPVDGPIELAPLLADVAPNSIVQLGDGTYLGPVRVPAGVTLRGLGHDRTVIDGRETTAVTLARGARLEHVTVRGGGQRIAWFPQRTVNIAEPHTLVLGCHIDGHIVVSADDSRIRACHASGVTATGVERLVVSRSRFTGMRWDVGIEIAGGAGHVVESCELQHHLCAIRISDAVGATVRGNTIVARWWGVHLVRTEASIVVGNAFAHTMRAVDVDAGALAHVNGNAVRDGDSGCIAEHGASGIDVSGNRWERCRIGLLAWDVTGLNHHDNDLIDLHDPDHAIVVGP